MCRRQLLESSDFKSARTLLRGPMAKIFQGGDFSRFALTRPPRKGQTRESKHETKSSSLFLLTLNSLSRVVQIGPRGPNERVEDWLLSACPSAKKTLCMVFRPDAAHPLFYFRGRNFLGAEFFSALRFFAPTQTKSGLAALVNRRGGQLGHSCLHPYRRTG